MPAGADQHASGPGSSRPRDMPSVTLPKGGGAVRGIGEKFAANPVTGTASISVPIGLSPGRSGFGPEVALTYDSGSGNGPFGLGWSLAVPAITRKTDKRIPQYLDTEDSDTFLLSGSEDLVPVPDELDPPEPPTVDGVTYLVRRYRPRVEGLFARIERWSDPERPEEVFWRSISRDNVTSWYGRTKKSRVHDPADPRRIFSWLLCQTHDDRGNVVCYDYKQEDSARVLEDERGRPVVKAHERHRTSQSRSAQRYLKHIRYGNRTPYFPALREDQPWPQPKGEELAGAGEDDAAAWLFHAVLDYGEHDELTPAETGVWDTRRDAFSSHRSGFEIRTYRTCRRILMFHHFEDVDEIGRNRLVRSTDLRYSDKTGPGGGASPVHTLLTSVTSTGYQQVGSETVERSMPRVVFWYSEAAIQDQVHEVDAASLGNLPVGLDGNAYRWADLDGEGVPGILTEQGDAWFYARNLTPLSVGQEAARFAPVEVLARQPDASLTEGADLMDLAGDGRLDMVVMDPPMAGFYERDDGQGWLSFRPFTSWPTWDVGGAEARLVDLDGDGLADLLVSRDDGLVWHPSAGEAGFGPERSVTIEPGDQAGPRLVLGDDTRSVYLADMSGDGLADLVRVRNGEVCYWPNLGHGRFSAMVTMDDAPWFDHPDAFDPRRLRLADVDGSGTTDLVYLHRTGVRLYFNQSGNGWATAHKLAAFPRVDDVVGIEAVDLLGNGTACLTWSSPLAADAGRQLRYVDLMGGIKPHLLVGVDNSLGAETLIDYAASTKYQLLDKRAGRPWITRLPFPVHVVEKVTTWDHVGRNRLVTRYAYHHGYFDGHEREFRGFGMVEQWDTEELGSLLGQAPPGPDGEPIPVLPPVHTKTWFHTGVDSGRERVASHYEAEYFQEPGKDPDELHALLLPDTELPPGLDEDEEREACRALKGSMLRQEIYADDAPDDADPLTAARAATPYSVAEQVPTVRLLQPKGDRRHAVFLVHPREALTYHYERSPADPRVEHEVTLEVDDHGNVLKQSRIAYGRRPEIVVEDDGVVTRVANPGLAELEPEDQTAQTTPLVVYTEHRFTNAVEDAHAHRLPLPCESVTYELTGFAGSGPDGRFQPTDLVTEQEGAPLRLAPATAEVLEYEEPVTSGACRRRTGWERTLYRGNDLTGLLSLGQLQSRALAGEQYRLAFTSGLIAQVFKCSLGSGPETSLLPDPAVVLEGQGHDSGGYLSGRSLKADGLFPDSDHDDRWWVPSGRTFFAAQEVNPEDELAAAMAHWFLPRRHRDPFGHDAVVDYDRFDLLTDETRDAFGNRTTVEVHDYRVLQPRLVSDANRNQVRLAFDALGQVVGTAVMGKPQAALEDGSEEGDSLDGFDENLGEERVHAFFESDDPAALASDLLRDATTRTLYDLDRFRRTRQAHPREPDRWEPACAATLARETHASVTLPPHGQRILVSVSHSDGFAREIQKKSQAEAGPVADERLADGGRRWLATGWTIFDNKGHAVRQYEPFFTGTARFEFAMTTGVSDVVFHDPLGRVAMTLHPAHTYDKQVTQPWKQISYDASDTCAPRAPETGDPRTDPDVKELVAGFFAGQPSTWQTWHQLRAGGGSGPEEVDAAAKAAAHAATPRTVHLDPLGRPFVTVARNRVVCADHSLDGFEDVVVMRSELDIDGHELAVSDQRRLPVDNLPTGARERRLVARHAYDMVGKPIMQAGLDSGTRWLLDDVSGKPIRSWDSRGHLTTTRYDALRRPVEQEVSGTGNDCDPRTRDRALIVDRIEYGESVDGAETLNIRTRVFRHFDTAGVATNGRLDQDGTPTAAYDFKGNLLHTTRQLLRDYQDLPDWGAAPQLGAERFESSSTYDALNRVVQVLPPRSNAAGDESPVIQPAYNERGLLAGIDVWLDRPAAPDRLLDPVVEPGSSVGVRAIEYDARGRRRRIDYHNGSATQYEYDRETFRLVRLRTRRGPAPTNGSSRQAADVLQDLRYTYDPVGNITRITDDARPLVFFRNALVDATNDYVYDALYRLVQATGREHLGQSGEAYSADERSREVLGAARGDLFAPDDRTSLGRYVERYVYDACGGLLQMRHARSDATNPGWRRLFDYEEESRIEAGPAVGRGPVGNRLSRTTVGRDQALVVEPYAHDAHGNVTSLPHLGDGNAGVNLAWDHTDRLVGSEHSGGGRAFYVYDAAGQRVRKVWEKAPGLVEERIYLGGSEIFRVHRGPIGVAEVRLERETLHVADGASRIALVESRTLDVDGRDPAPPRVVRYHCGNHLGSVVLELDDRSQIISYAEYAPFGSTTYRNARGESETPGRYRFAGKERDEETGLYYCDDRYYAAWIGRWTRPDPSGLADGPNGYVYCSDNPVALHDPHGRSGEPPPQLHLIEQAFIDTVGTLKGYSQTTLIQNFVKNFARLWGENPDDYEAGHHASTPQWSTPPGGAQKIGPQNKIANNVQSQQEAIDRSAAAAGGQYHRTGRAHQGPGVNPPSAPLTPEIRQIAKLKPGEIADRLPDTAATTTEGAAAPTPAAPSPPAAGAPGEQLPLDFNKPTTPAAKQPAAAASATSGAPAAAARPAVPAVRAPAAASRGGSGMPGAAVKGLLPAVGKGAAVGLAGGLARTFIPGAAEALEFASVSQAVGVANAGRLAVAAVPRAGWVGVAAVAGAATGYAIEQNAPGYTAHAADFGEAVHQKSGNLVLGGMAAAATVIPGAWIATRATKGWLW